MNESSKLAFSESQQLDISTSESNAIAAEQIMKLAGGIKYRSTSSLSLESAYKIPENTNLDVSEDIDSPLIEHSIGIVDNTQKDKFQNSFDPWIQEIPNVSDNTCSKNESEMPMSQSSAEQFYQKAIESSIETNKSLIAGIQSQVDTINSHLNIFTASLAALMAIGFSIIFFAFQSQFEAVNSKIDSTDAKNQARYDSISSKIDSINTKFEAINQRLNDQKDYIDAKTESK